MFITVLTILLFVKYQIVDAAGRGTFSSKRKSRVPPAFVICFCLTIGITKLP